MLVEGILGACVTWPEPHEIPTDPFRARGFDPTTTTESTDATEEPPEEEDLEWFRGAQMLWHPRTADDHSERVRLRGARRDSAHADVGASRRRPSSTATDGGLDAALHTARTRDGSSARGGDRSSTDTNAARGRRSGAQSKSWTTCHSPSIPQQEAATPPRRSGIHEPTQSHQMSLHDLRGARWTQIHHWHPRGIVWWSHHSGPD